MHNVREGSSRICKPSTQVTHINKGCIVKWNQLDGMCQVGCLFRYINKSNQRSCLDEGPLSPSRHLFPSKELWAEGSAEVLKPGSGWDIQPARGKRDCLQSLQDLIVASGKIPFFFLQVCIYQMPQLSQINQLKWTNTNSLRTQRSGAHSAKGLVCKWPEFEKKIKNKFSYVVEDSLFFKKIKTPAFLKTVFPEQLQCFKITSLHFFKIAIEMFWYFY